MTKNRQKKLEARRLKASGAGSYTRALREASEGSAFIRKPISVPTGFSVLDEWIGGWQPGSFSVIGARLGEGGSAFATHSALTALKAKKSVLFVAPDSSPSQIRSRMVASMASVPLSTLELETSPYTGRQIGNARSELSSLKLSVLADPRQPVEDILSHARMLQASEDGLDLIVIDSFELLRLSVGDPVGLRSEYFTEISRQLKLMAMELDLPVVLVAWLNASHAEPPVPSISDFRHTGALTQDADQVVLLHRSPTEWKEEDIITVNLAKNRRGSTGRVGELAVDFSRMSFTELPARGNPILREYYRGLYAGEFTLSELLDGWTVDGEGATEAHRREAAAELRALEPFRSDFAASERPLELAGSFRINGWGMGHSDGPLRGSDGLTVWELGEDGGSWFVEGTLDRLRAIAAVREWLEETERGVSSAFSQAAGPFSAWDRADFFWKGFFRSEAEPEPTDETELLNRSRNPDQWSGETTFAGVLVQG